jgi:hypothetical protein
MTVKYFLILLYLTIYLEADTVEEDVWQNFNSPSKRYSVRLREGWAIGNCTHDQARLIDTKTSKELFNFDSVEEVGGGFEKNSVVWSPDSRLVAVYKRSHRYGEPLVIRISNGRAKACTFPEIALPHEKNPAIQGRNSQLWQTPIKWLTKTTLFVEVSGRIDQIPDVPFWIDYSYDVHLTFDEQGKGKVDKIILKEFIEEDGKNEEKK